MAKANILENSYYNWLKKNLISKISPMDIFRYQLLSLIQTMTTLACSLILRIRIMLLFLISDILFLILRNWILTLTKETKPFGVYLSLL